MHKTVIAIVVTYNGMKWYERCFNSLKNSSIPIDIIVIDNKSSDDTINYIKQYYPSIHLIESPVNWGFGKANNIGLEYAIEKNADYVFLLNQDAWVKPDTIEALIRKMEEYPEYGILSPIHLNGTEVNLDYYFSNHYISEQGCPSLITDTLSKGEVSDKIYPMRFVNAALWLISKECLNKVGGFNPLYPHYGEDEDYIERVKFHGYKIGLYPKVYGVHDRKNKARIVKSFSKKKEQSSVISLVFLTNINRSFKVCIKSLTTYRLKSFIKNVLHLRVRFAFVDIVSTLNDIFMLKSIHKYRNMSKNNKHPFLQGDFKSESFRHEHSC